MTAMLPCGHIDAAPEDAAKLFGYLLWAGTAVCLLIAAIYSFGQYRRTDLSWPRTQIRCTVFGLLVQAIGFASAGTVLLFSYSFSAWAVSIGLILGSRLSAYYFDSRVFRGR